MFRIAAAVELMKKSSAPGLDDLSTGAIFSAASTHSEELPSLPDSAFILTESFWVFKNYFRSPMKCPKGSAICGFLWAILMEKVFHLDLPKRVFILTQQ
jgi:hypothetical protein